MENASKALIIAGAILLSIVIISLGFIIFTQAQNTVGSVNMSEQEIMAFNNKFTTYEGRTLRGTEVNALAQSVLSNNKTAADNGETDTKGIAMTGEVKMQNKGEDTGITRLPAGSLYKISITYKNGLVNKIDVSKANQNSNQ